VLSREDGEEDEERVRPSRPFILGSTALCLIFQSQFPNRWRTNKSGLLDLSWRALLRNGVRNDQEPSSLHGVLLEEEQISLVTRIWNRTAAARQGKAPL